MIKSFKLKRVPRHADEETVKVGMTVYECAKYDYGLARDDTNFTGIYHISVTLDPTGDYHYFTVPFDSLEPTA